MVGSNQMIKRGQVCEHLSVNELELNDTIHNLWLNAS